MHVNNSDDYYTTKYINARCLSCNRSNYKANLYSIGRVRKYTVLVLEIQYFL